MFLHHFNRMGCVKSVVVFGICLFICPALGQVGSASTSVVGEINSNDVYVRSGDSLNHYTVCKLSAGDKVSIRSERGEWYEIVPPAGNFSLISGDYVDRADNKGTVNGNNVRVRAGSLLSDNKYTVQSMLNKGDTVTIVGVNPDGFLRIEPPSGATLWINKQFVSLPGSGGTPIASTAAPVSSTAQTPSSEVTSSPVVVADTRSGADTRADSHIKAPATATTPSAPIVASTAIPSDSPLSGVSASDQVRKLHSLETALRAELTKPPFDRQLASLVTGFQSIADQTEDDVARRYAAGRLTQLSELMDLTNRASRLRSLDGEAAHQREEFLQKRVSIPAPPPPDPAALDVQGELRESSLYPAGTLPRRFRLVDSSGDRVRTIAYIEVPVESGLRAEEFIGRQVGVRASGKRPHEGGIDPVPVFVARELVAVGHVGSAVTPVVPMSYVAPVAQAVPSSPVGSASAMAPTTFQAPNASGIYPAAKSQPPATVNSTPDGTSIVILRDVK